MYVCKYYTITLCMHQTETPFLPGVICGSTLRWHLIKMFIKPIYLGVIGSSVQSHALHQLHIHSGVEFTPLIGSDDVRNTHDEK